MKTKAPINVPILAIVLSLLSLSVSAAEGKAGSVSVAIQATARVVPSQGLAVAPIEMEMPKNRDKGVWWLWISDSEDIQIQIKADGQLVNGQMSVDESDLNELLILERHRYKGLIRHRLQIDSLPSGGTCTVTIVNSAN